MSIYIYLGVLLNVMLPDILILIMLAMVLSYATARTSRKGLLLWRKETQEMQATEEKRGDTEAAKGMDIEMQRSTDCTTENGHRRDHETDDNETDLEDEGGDIDDDADSMNPTKSTTKMGRVRTVSDALDGTTSSLAVGCGIDPAELTAENVPFCREWMERESQMARPLAMMGMVWIGVSVFSVLRKREITGIEACSPWYWSMYLLPIPLMVFISYYMTKREHAHYHSKVGRGCWVPAAGDMDLRYFRVYDIGQIMIWFALL